MMKNLTETLRAEKNLKGLEDEDFTLRAKENLKGNMNRKINLQLFAEGGSGSEGSGEAGESGEAGKGTEGSGETGGSDEAEFTIPNSVEELKLLLESYSDQKVTKAVKTREERLREEARKEKEKAVQTALARQKMTEEERIQAEYKDKLEDLEKEKREYERKNLYTETVRELTKRNLPIGVDGEVLDSDMASILMADDLETTTKNIEAFEKIFNRSVQKQVKIQLSNPNPPRKGSSQIKTDEEEKINRAEMARNKSIR